ncbi:MAG: hypothetical protein RR327_08635, partial [Clostridia bacterium]
MTTLQILPYIFCGLTVVFACVFMAFRQMNSKFRTLGFKATAGVFFILTALFSYLNNNGDPLFATLVVCGGLFGLMG